MIVTNIERRKRDSRRVTCFIRREFRISGINEECGSGRISDGYSRTEEGAVKDQRGRRRSQVSSRNLALRLLSGWLRRKPNSD